MYSIQQDGNLVRYTDSEEQRELRIPAENFMGLFETGNPPSLPESAYREAVLSPVGGETLARIVARKQAKTVCIIVSDATRGVPTREVLPYLLEELRTSGIRDEDIVFVVALGVHRDATTDEMREFLGDAFGHYRIENHDAYDAAKLVDLGKTSRGTPVRVNKTVYNSDLVITIGKVELHDMAGFSGGRKSILPGVSSEETIVINHRPDMIVDLGSYAGNLEGNQIHEDMLETARMCGVDYTVNIVMNQEYRIAGIFAGELNEAHVAAAAFLSRYCYVELPEKPDIYVVCPGEPLSIDMYQGVKALIALHPIVDEDTTVILYGSFAEGVNSPDFLETFREHPDLEELKEYVWSHYKIQMDHIVPIREILRKKTRVMVVSEHVPERDIRAFHMEKKANLQEALDEALAGARSEKPRVAVCPQSYRCIWKLPQG